LCPDAKTGAKNEQETEAKANRLSINSLKRVLTDYQRSEIPLKVSHYEGEYQN